MTQSSIFSVRHWMPWKLTLFPISILHVPSPMHLKCLLQSHSLLYAKTATKKDCSLLWSTSKPRSLNSIFIIEYRFLWKGQSIFKSWMDNLKVIYSWLIFRGKKKKNPTPEYIPDLLNLTLIRIWLNFSFTQFSPFLGSELVNGMSLAMLSSVILPSYRNDLFLWQDCQLEIVFACWAICSDGWYKEQ